MVKKKGKVAPPKSRAPFYGLVALVAVVGIAGIWYVGSQSGTKPIVLDENIPIPESNGYLLGDSTAPVTIMQFADFECPGCMQFATMIEPDIRTNIVEKGLASFRYFDYPLTDIHPNSMSASLAAACADEQGKFWQMHDAIYAGFYDWVAQVTSNPKKVFQSYLGPLGIDSKQWNECFDSQKYVGRIMAHRNAGLARQVSGTPTFVINNVVYQATGMNYDRFKTIVDSLIRLAPPAAATDTASN